MSRLVHCGWGHVCQRAQGVDCVCLAVQDRGEGNGVDGFVGVSGVRGTSDIRPVCGQGECINAETTLVLFKRIECTWPEARTVQPVLCQHPIP